MNQPLVNSAPNKLAVPELKGPKKNMKRPEHIGMRVDLRFERETAQQLFPMLEFDPEDTHVTISECYRPCKPGEEKLAVMHHLPSNVRYVVDHYEFEGHKL